MDEYDIWKRHRLYKDFLGRIESVNRVLEVGCGTGDNIAHCSAQIRDAIDVSPKMIEEARKRHPNINFSTIDIMKGSLEPGYDLIIALGVIQYVRDYARFLEIVTRLLAPGGYLVLSFPNANSVFRQIHYMNRIGEVNQIDHSAAEICNLLEQHGLDSIRLNAHSSGLPNSGRFSSRFWLAVSFILDALKGVPGFKVISDRLGYSYLGLFRKRL